MIRAAAKNHALVGVVTDPADYPACSTSCGPTASLSADTRRRLARTAFAHTAAYDAAIVAWFDEGDDDRSCPPTLHVAAKREPVARCATARTRTSAPRSTAPTAPTRGGPTPRSTAASPSATSTSTTPMPPGCSSTTSAPPPDRPAVAIIKHANPCGAAVADTLADAYQQAFECDPRSAFGGIVALKRPVDDGHRRRRWSPPPRPTS